MTDNNVIINVKNLFKTAFPKEPVPPVIKSVLSLKILIKLLLVIY